MLLRLTPGNIADILFDAGGFVDPADKARIEADLGLDKSIPVQYVTWIGGFADRRSWLFLPDRENRHSRRSRPRIPITAKLAGLALTFSVLIGVPLGVISAVKQNSRLDYVFADHQPIRVCRCRLFWLGLLILMFFVTYFGTIPIYSDAPTSFLEGAGDVQRPGGGRRLSQLGLADAIDAVPRCSKYCARITSAPPAPRVRRKTTINYYHALKKRVVAGGHGGSASKPRFCSAGLIVTETVFNIPRRRPVSGRGDPLARLPDGFKIS